MLAAVALLCADAWLLTLFPDVSLIGRAIFLGLPLAAVTGAAIGCFAGRPFVGACVGFVAYYVTLFAFFFLSFVAKLAFMPQIHL